MNALKKLFTNSWVEWGARLILGVTFIYASFHKMSAPAAFAKIVYGYDLFPAVAINLIAIVVPFFELVAGVALVLGVFPRSAALVMNGMLAVFMVVLAINLARGRVFDCGCFSLGAQGETASTAEVLVRDFVLLALGLLVLLHGGPRKGVIKTGPNG